MLEHLGISFVFNIMTFVKVYQRPHKPSCFVMSLKCNYSVFLKFIN
jgi:hypothetical protein